MKPELTVIEGGAPYFVEQLERLIALAKSGELQGLAIVSIRGDQIFTSWTKAPGISKVEMLGAAHMLADDMMRDVQGR